MHHHRSKLPVLTDAHCTRMMRLCCYELIDMYGSWSGRGGGEGRAGVQEADRGGGRPGGLRTVRHCSSTAASKSAQVTNQQRRRAALWIPSSSIFYCC